MSRWAPPAACLVLLGLAVQGAAARPHHPGGCSAGGLSPTLARQWDLTPAAARMRQRIVNAAVRCDFAGLQHLTEEGSQPFTYSFGDPGDPGTFWQHEEARGAHPLVALVKLLAMPVAIVSGGLQYAWPSAYGDTAREADWAALGGLYTPDAIAHFRQVGYLGYRVGITQTGDWLYFVQGE